jgi:hypothetical protein
MVSPSPSPSSQTGEPSAAGIDPRGPRFVAGVTSVVLAAALLTGSVWVLAVQVAVFGIGVARGIAASPYAWAFRRFVRPRLSAPTELEDPAPPRFAQGVGLGVTGIGVVLALAGVPLAVEVSAAVALVAAVLNAAFGICLGCLMYLRLVRLRAS